MIFGFFTAMFFMIPVAFEHCCIDAGFVVRHLVEASILGIAFAVSAVAWRRFLTLPARARRSVRHFPWLYQELSATLDEDGFVLRSAHSQTNWRWVELRGFRESECLFLLCPQRSGYIIPKRRFSADELAALDALVRRKLRKLN